MRGPKSIDENESQMSIEDAAKISSVIDDENDFNIFVSDDLWNEHLDVEGD